MQHYSGSKEDDSPLNECCSNDTSNSDCNGTVTGELGILPVEETKKEALAAVVAADAVAQSSKLLRRPHQDCDCPMPHQVEDLVKRLLSLFHRHGRLSEQQNLNDCRNSSIHSQHHRNDNNCTALRHLELDYALSLPAAAIQFLWRHFEEPCSSRRDASTRRCTAPTSISSISCSSTAIVEEDKEWRLIRRGLARVTRLRITNEPWPKPDPSPLLHTVSTGSATTGTTGTADTAIATETDTTNPSSARQQGLAEPPPPLLFPQLQVLWVVDDHRNGSRPWPWCWQSRLDVGRLRVVRIDSFLPMRLLQDDNRNDNNHSGTKLLCDSVSSATTTVAAPPLDATAADTATWSSSSGHDASSLPSALTHVQWSTKCAQSDRMHAAEAAAAAPPPRPLYRYWRPCLDWLDSAWKPPSVHNSTSLSWSDNDWTCTELQSLLQTWALHEHPPPQQQHTWNASLAKLDLSRNALGTERVPVSRETVPIPNHDHGLVWSSLVNIFANLHTLNVSYCGLDTLQGMECLVSLDTLHLQGNALTDVHGTARTLATLPRLATLSLADNPWSATTTITTTTTTTSSEQTALATTANSAGDRAPNSAHTTGTSAASARQSLRRHRDYNSAEPLAPAVPAAATTTTARVRRRLRRSTISSNRAVTALTSELKGDASSLEYRIWIWNAFLQRRLLSIFPPDAVPTVTRRHVQAILPTLDQIPMTLLEWQALQQQTLMPVALQHYTPSSLTRSGGGRPSTRPLRKAIIYDMHNGIPFIQLDQTSTVDALAPPSYSSWPMPSMAYNTVDVLASMASTEPSRSDDDALGDTETTVSAISMDAAAASSSLALERTIAYLEENIGQQYLASIATATPICDNRNRESATLSGPSSIQMCESGQDTATPMVSANHSVDSEDNADSLALENHTLDSSSKAEDITDIGLSLEASKDESKMVVSVTPPPSVRRDMKESKTTSTLTGTPSLAPTMKRINVSSVRNNSSANSLASSSLSPNSPNKLSLRVTSFSENHWQDDAFSDPIFMSSTTTPSLSTSTLVSDKALFQTAEQNSNYTGPKAYARLLIRENLELYFRLFVFAATSSPSEEAAIIALFRGDEHEERRESALERFQQHPRIQVWPLDRTRRDEETNKTPPGNFVDHLQPRETFCRVWKEKIVACGKAALRRLTPSRSARYGFHGELLWSAAESSHMKPEIVVECRDTICCFSDTCFYIIVDHDVVTSKAKDQKREFPIPIPDKACFKDAKWPHALACHSFQALTEITIGFGFQRLTLHFTDPSSAEGFVYIMLTSNKLETVALLKELQDLRSSAHDAMLGKKEAAPIRIENDDPHVLNAIAIAVAPDPVGVVLHYQILHQRWKSGGRGAVRRVCVVTDTKVFLLDEDYIGDGSESLDSPVGRRIGQSRNRVVDSADLLQIVQLQAADADPNAITIVIKSSVLKRLHNWRLLCRDGEGAEKLVEAVRKATYLASQ
jgi:hypothetical protein